MRIFYIFLLIPLASSTQKLTKSKEIRIFSNTIKDVVNELFTRHDLPFDIIIFGKVTPHTHDIIDGFRHDQFYTKILSLIQHSNWPRGFSSAAVIFCESLDEIKSLLTEGIGKVIFPSKIKFLFYVEKPFDLALVGLDKLDGSVGRRGWFSYFFFKIKSKFRVS